MLVNRIAHTTRVIGKSQGYVGLPISDRQILDHTSNTMVNSMSTAWAPTPKEIAAILNGASIYITLLGTVHPPILITVGESEHERLFLE